MPIFVLAKKGNAVYNEGRTKSILRRFPYEYHPHPEGSRRHRPLQPGLRVNDLVFTSGQIPVDPATGAIPEGIAAQCEQSCKNVAAILEAAGVSMDKVFKTTCFLADMGDFAAFNEVYAQYFVSKPARSCVAVKTLPKGVLCEIEAIAIK